MLLFASKRKRTDAAALRDAGAVASVWTSGRSSETRYARSGDLQIAYQVVGEGPLDIVFVPAWVSNIEMFWEIPSLAHLFTRLASFLG